MTHRIIVADVLAGLGQLADESVQCVVTSPPYWGLRDYGTGTWEGGDPACDHRKVTDPEAGSRGSGLEGGKLSNGHQQEGYKERCGRCGARRIDHQIGLEPTPAAYLERMVAVFREVRRVLRSDGTCWVNMGDGYTSGDRAIWRSGASENKGQDVQNGQARPSTPPGLKPKDLIGMPWRLAFALQADGWWLRSEIIWAKCLSGGARVYARTQKGDMPMTIKDLVRLDPATVKLWNGERWTAAVSWKKTQRRGNEIELVLRSGERIGCTPEHRWPTERGIVSASEIRVGDVIQTCRLPVPEHPRTPSALDDADSGGEVMQIVQSRARQFWDIAVADEPHLFALASGVLTHNSNPMPESVTDRPTKSHEQIFLLTKSARYFYDAEAVKERGEGVRWSNDAPEDRNDDARKSGRAHGKESHATGTRTGTNLANAYSGVDWSVVGRNLRSVWSIATQPFPDAHFATFPEEIPRRCIKAGTSERGACPACGSPWERVVERTAMVIDRSTRTHAMGQTRSSGTMLEPPESRTTGWRPTCEHYPRTEEWVEIPRQDKDESDEQYAHRIAPIVAIRAELVEFWAPMESVPCTVFDPFAGSGTTLAVALQLGRHAIGIELNPEYAAMAEDRIGRAVRPNTHRSERPQDAPLFAQDGGT